jgi:dinuclear metal center YbgI/SA1388 family protein
MKECLGNEGTHMARREDIDVYLHTLLDVGRFKDYGPNGLQVQGQGDVQLIVSGVTASLALIEEAARLKAQAVLVHHGLFWRGHDGRLVGWLAERVRCLMHHQINLFAYHLPLDAHAELGNNAQLGKRLGLPSGTTFGDQALGHLATIENLTLQELAQRVQTTLQRAPTVVPGDGRVLRRIAWCTGGAQGYFEAAIQAGADAYITGEISEPQAHLARETGVAYLACGHHATERFGAPAVAAHVAAHFGLQHHFVEIDNPA